MPTAYIAVMLSGAVICAALFACRLRQKKLNAFAAVWGLPLALAFGFAGAKIAYFLLRLGRDWLSYGWGGLLLFAPYQFSFLGGCLGVALGVMLALRVSCAPLKEGLDAFAPAGALMAAFARGAEYFLDETNVSGSEIENEFFRRFPFGVTNEYDECYFALFFLCALFALAVCVFGLLRRREENVPGLLFERTVFYLCLPQVFCESLRNDSIMWGFVRPEQLFCVIIMFLLLAYSCWKTKGKGFWRDFRPLFVFLFCVIVLVFVEFNLDKTFIEISHAADYVLMGAALLGIAFCECRCTARRYGQGKK